MSSRHGSSSERVETGAPGLDTHVASAVPFDQRGSGGPVVIGVRHHSPACARLVAARIAELRPAHVLVEGPADVNDRIDEFHLGHDLPIAVHSYLSTPEVHHSSWSPLAEHSPEWQALVAGREVGARVRFIDLPSWHPALADLDNRYADAADADEAARAADYTAAVGRRLGIDDSDALWDHLFEAQVTGPLDDLEAALRQWFTALRGGGRGSQGNAAREDMMARWISWAVGTGQGPVLVVCGGYHAPALARAWRAVPTTSSPPETPLPPGHDTADVRYGSFLVPYSFRRLDSFTGYASGMPSPAYHQWLWEAGPEVAGLRLLEEVRNRLRARRLPTSTATVLAVHTHAHGLARLRGHRVPLRTDWLDAMAAGWVSDALEVPVPWSYRGTIRPGTDPVLVEVMDAVSGEREGRLAAGTPQPPLVAAVAADLAAHHLPVTGTVRLDLLDDRSGEGHDRAARGPSERARSRVLHRLRILGIPGVERISGPSLALGPGPGGAREHHETWRLHDSPYRLSGLIEAGAWGGTLAEAARARWTARLPGTVGNVTALAVAVDEAIWAGLTESTRQVVGLLAEAVGAEQDLGALGAALRVLLPLARHPELVGVESASVLPPTVDAIVDRTLWLLEPPTAVPPAEVDRHLGTVIGLRDVVRTMRSHPASGVSVRPDRVLAVLTRKVADHAADPASRGAALGALVSLDSFAELPQMHAPGVENRTSGEARRARQDDPLTLLDGIPGDRLGDALAGLLALAREELAGDPRFVAGLDRLVTGLDGAAFVGALPALRGAFAWLPPRERGGLAEQVLALHGRAGASGRQLTGRVTLDPVATAGASRTEAEVFALLDEWGVR